MGSKQKSSDGRNLPDWARGLWEQLDKPDFLSFADIPDGPLIERRHGLRRDDLVEVELDARAYPGDTDLIIRGRLMSSGKTMIELLDSEGEMHYVAKDVIVRLLLVAHMRPPYIDDDELLSFEKEDQKRRSKLHEKVERETQGTDDGHIWG